MKKYQVFVILAAICVIAFSCSQPQAPTGTTAPKTAPEKTVETAAPAPAPAPAEVAKEKEPAEKTAMLAPQPAAADAAQTTPAAETATDAANATGEPAVEGGTPKLVVPEPVFDFGSMQDTETLNHKFLLRNEGTGILKITNVRPSCGCTTTELEKNELAPGEEVNISAAVNLSGRQGKQVKAITVTTNDPNNQSVQLRMEGMVTASINVEPDRVNFGEILDDESRENIVNITSTVDDLTFTVQSAEVAEMDFIDYEIKEVTPGKAYQVIVKAKGPMPVGQHNGRMIIRTDAKIRPVIFLNISAQVIGPLQIMPPVIHIRHSDTPGEVTSQQLRISPGRVKEFELTEVVCPVEGMQGTLTPQGENVYLLRLDNIPSSDILQDKSVILKTNLDAYKEVPIPFNVAKLRVPPTPAAGSPAVQGPQKLMQLTPEQKEMMLKKAEEVKGNVARQPITPQPEAPAPAPEAAPAQ